MALSQSLVCIPASRPLHPATSCWGCAVPNTCRMCTHVDAAQTLSYEACDLLPLLLLCQFPLGMCVWVYTWCAGSTRHRQDSHPAGFHRGHGQQPARDPFHTHTRMCWHQRSCGQHCGGLDGQEDQYCAPGPTCQGTIFRTMYRLNHTFPGGLTSKKKKITSFVWQWLFDSTCLQFHTLCLLVWRCLAKACVLLLPLLLLLYFLFFLFFYFFLYFFFFFCTFFLFTFFYFTFFFFTFFFFFFFFFFLCYMIRMVPAGEGRSPVSVPGGPDRKNPRRSESYPAA